MRKLLLAGAALALVSPALAQMTPPPVRYGTTSGTAAVGNDGRITGAVQAAGGDASQAKLTPTGGTTALTFANYAASVLDVRAYGVKCDGVTDDTAALQAVAAVSAGKHVRFPAGTCLVAGTITFAGSYTHLQGAGIYSTTILQTADAVDTIVFSPTSPTTQSIYGSHISDMWIRRTATTTAGAGLKVVAANGFVAENLDIRDFYENLVVLGSGGAFTNLSITAGGYWSGILSGSSLIRLGCNTNAGGNCVVPGEAFFTGLSAKGATNDYVDVALRIQAGDGLWFTSGHIGFSQTQVLITPVVNGAGIQSVYMTNLGIDGNNAAPTGISIPLMTTTGGHVTDIVLVGGDVEDLTGNGIDIREPTAQLTLNGTPIRNITGWGVNALSVGNLAITNAPITNVGNASGGGINLGTVKRLNLAGIAFSGITGSCVVGPTALAGTDSNSNVSIIGLTYDTSCSTGSTRPGTMLNATQNNVSQVAGFGALAGGYTSTANGPGAIAFGNAAVASQWASQAFGDTVQVDAYMSSIMGYNGHVHTRYGVHCESAGMFTNYGDAQHCRTVLRGTVTGTGSGTSSVRLTADGNAARNGGNGSNCLNIPNTNAMAVQLRTVVRSNTTAGVAAIWGGTGMLTRDANAGTTAWVGYSPSSPTTSSGAASGAALSVTADTTLGCLNITGTTPNNSADLWHFVTDAEWVEVK